MGFGAQLSLSAFTGSGIVSDTLVINGDARGVQLGASGTAVVRANNLTIVGHPADRGLLANLFGSAQLSVYNSIAVNSGVNAQLGTGVTQGSNIFVNDPGLFRDLLGGDYRLALGSSAIDAGDNTPPGGLGPFDLDGQARMVGSVVDIGAYESNDLLFSDRFEN